MEYRNPIYNVMTHESHICGCFILAFLIVQSQYPHQYYVYYCKSSTGYVQVEPRKNL